MSSAPSLHWLAEDPDWRRAAAEFRAAPTWDAAVRLAGSRLDFVRTNMLATLIGRAFGDTPPPGALPVRLAVLSSSTATHLLPALQVAAARRGIFLTTYEAAYGQYRQELADPAGALQAFAPTAVLLAFDPWHLTAAIHPGMTAAQADGALADAVALFEDCWRAAAQAFGCPILQQTVIPALPALLGSNEHRLPGSPADVVRRLNDTLHDKAERAGVHLVALDARIAIDGLAAWHDTALWHRSKQEVTPAAAPFYGDLVGRVLAALNGRSSKCLVMDLDNTLWGGVVGDDGLDGIVLGQGSATGEAFAAVQNYAKALSARGVILAVCSKNDEAVALEPFERHPEMVLRQGDIAAFVANWNDKAANIRAIAAALNIGLESLVFLDDNPAERDIVRRELPMVAVPEIGDDPAFYPHKIADAGYFESIGITDDDRSRGGQYQANLQREVARDTATDMASYLRGLQMRMVWQPFDTVGLGRIVQLINKTNQFNLTTRRYSAAEVAAMLSDPRYLGVQLRVIDRFGDNGIVAVVIGVLEGDALVIDSWLMSCRVLGRQVEAETLNLIAERARALGAKRLIGRYRPTAKNGIVRDHYPRLGFAPRATALGDATEWGLELHGFAPQKTFIATSQG